MLKRLTERAWYLPWEEETDRPNLCYLLGELAYLAAQAGSGRPVQKEGAVAETPRGVC